MDFLARSDLEALPTDRVVWVQLYGYGDGEHWPQPLWQGEATLSEDSRWPGLRELRRADDGAELSYLDFRHGGRDIYMGEDGTLEISERHYARLYPDEQAANRDYARRKGEHDQGILDLASALAGLIPSQLPVDVSELERPALSVLEREGEIWIEAPLRDLTLVVSADLFDHERVLVRRQSPDGSPLDELSAPETWAGDTPLAALTAGQLGDMLDRLS